jgi:hypothetical protein
LSVLKDHVTRSSTWNGQPVSEQVYSPFDSAIRQVAASAFTGNGGLLQRVGGVFALAGPDGRPNTAGMDDFFFRFAFYEDDAAFSLDPYAETGAATIRFHRFSTPSNASWQTVVGSAPTLEPNPFLLFYWEFDVSFLNIQTTPGVDHLVSLVGEPQSVDAGSTLISLSTGGTEAVGDNVDWGQSELFGLAANTLPNLGSPYEQIAFLVKSTRYCQ